MSTTKKVPFINSLQSFVRSAINKVKKTISPITRQPIITFNNQSSIIMKVKAVGLWCLFHDNRIFAFTPQDEADSGTAAQNILLDLMTIPKYRLMNFMYLGFLILNHMGFALFFILSLLNWSITLPVGEDYALIAVLMTEVFYDVLTLTHVFWILQRMSFWIAILLYAGYYYAIWWKYSVGLYDPPPGCPLPIGIDMQATTSTTDWTLLGATVAASIDPPSTTPLPPSYTQCNPHMVAFGFVTLRLVAFLLEEAVDLSIDILLHNDLLALMVKREQTLASRSTTIQVDNTIVEVVNDAEEDTPLSPATESTPLIPAANESTHLTLDKSTSTSLHWYTIDITADYNLPQGINYYGSIFAWIPVSILGSHKADCRQSNCDRTCNEAINRQIWQCQQISKCILWPLLALPLIIGTTVALIILALCIIGAIIAHICLIAWFVLHFILCSPCYLYQCVKDPTNGSNGYYHCSIGSICNGVKNFWQEIFYI